MTERRSLDLKLVLSVLAAFLLSMAFTWFLHTRLSERDAYALIDRTFTAVEAEIIDCVDERLVRLCLAVRERLEDDTGDALLNERTRDLASLNCALRGRRRENVAKHEGIAVFLGAAHQRLAHDREHLAHGKTRHYEPKSP